MPNRFSSVVQAGAALSLDGRRFAAGSRAFGTRRTGSPDPADAIFSILLQLIYKYGHVREGDLLFIRNNYPNHLKSGNRFISK